MKSNDRRATVELLIATIDAAIARGCKHYSEGGELLATTGQSSIGFVRFFGFC